MNTIVQLLFRIDVSFRTRVLFISKVPLRPEEPPLVMDSIDVVLTMGEGEERRPETA